MFSGAVCAPANAIMMGAMSGRKSQVPPATALSSVHVDVKTRIGARVPRTPTGYPSLDRAFGGGLRPGMVLGIAGAPGSGRTTLAVLMAYLAARSKAATVLAAVGLDETEVVARLASRALRRSEPPLKVPYSEIWDGTAQEDAARRGPVLAAIDGVSQKIGTHLHLLKAESLEPTKTLSHNVSKLSARNERVVLVVDDIEAWSAARHRDEARSSSTLGRVQEVGLELSRIAREGCAVVLTVLEDHARAIAPGLTALVALAPSPDAGRQADQEARAELRLTKNRMGPTAAISVRFSPEITLIEEG